MEFCLSSLILEVMKSDFSCSSTDHYALIGSQKYFFHTGTVHLSEVLWLYPLNVFSRTWALLMFAIRQKKIYLSLFLEINLKSL